VSRSFSRGLRLPGTHGVPCNRHHQFFRADDMGLPSFGSLVPGEPHQFKGCVYIQEGIVNGNSVLLRIVFCSL
jgi:hypothetical protein